MITSNIFPNDLTRVVGYFEKYKFVGHAIIPIKFGIGKGESGDLGHLQLRLRYRWKALDPRMKACYALSPTWGPGRDGRLISGSLKRAGASARRARVGIIHDGVKST